MIQYKRKINEFEKMFAKSNQQCQIAVEVESPSFIPLLINNFKKSMIGFNLKLQGDEIIYQKMDIPVYSLPKNIRTCKDAANYVDLHLKVNLNETLCKIAANENIVAISATHMIYDGGFFIDLFPKLLNEKDDENYLNFSNPRKVPFTPKEIFPNEFQRKNMKELIKRNFDDLLHIPHVRYSAYRDPDVNNDSYIISHSHECPASEYQFLENKMGLTDMYWTIIPLCVMALDDTNQDMGMSFCVDFRQLMNKTALNRLITQNFTQINIHAEGATPKMTIRQVGKLIRQKFNQRKIDGTLFASFSGICEGRSFDLPPSLFAGMSNIGRFNYKRPIVDCWAQQTLMSKFNGCYAAFSCFSKTKHGVNTVNTRFLQPPTLLNNADSKALFESVVYAMKNIPVDVTVEEAYDQIRRFQSKIRAKK